MKRRRSLRTRAGLEQPRSAIRRSWIICKRDFMSRFGYLEAETEGGSGSPSQSLVRVEQAIRDVQRFGGIPLTGRLDNDTLQLMRSRRCGLPDTQLTQSSPVTVRKTGRPKRYILGPTRPWPKQYITYFISNWTPKIGLTAIRREMRRALDAWARYGRLKFQEVISPDADIIVAFGTGFHGDPYPFDGPGSTLAHAFFPGEEGSLGGDVHFDDDEPWKINPGPFEEGVDFFTVAVHEIGHSLGLSHSPEQGSVMNPYYRRLDDQGFNLGYDDIQAMYQLYITNSGTRDNSWDVDDNQPDYGGRMPHPTVPRTTPPRSTMRPTLRPTRRTTTSEHWVTYIGDDESVDEHMKHDPKHRVPGPVEPLTPSSPSTSLPAPSTTPQAPDACSGHFSAVANLRGELFIFKGNMTWRLSAPGRIVPGFPVPLHRMFNNLPQTLQRIDAAYERTIDSNIVFFSGDKYWVYNGHDILAGNPRSIYDYGLPHYVKKIDAVMVWDKNKKTYIFSGDQFWRFNETSHTMDPGYPKSIELFREVPPNLDSAMTWSDGVTYFFKDDLYWAFNNTWLKAESFYPQQASDYWLACR